MQKITPCLWFDEVMQDKDPERTERFMKAVLQMKKLDIGTLMRAYEQH